MASTRNPTCTLAAFICATLALAGLWRVHAQTAIPYQKPPAPIEQLLDAPAIPTASLSPDRTLLLIQQPQTFPSIAEVAEPRYRLAGLRFSPVVSGPSVVTNDIAMHLQAVAVGSSPKDVTGLPAKLKASDAIWSPDSKHIAFVQRSDTALELWVVDTATARAHRLGLVKLNAILGRPCAWMPNSTELLCKIIPANRGAAPKTSGRTQRPARQRKTSAKPRPRPPMKTCSPRRTTRTSSSTMPAPSSLSSRSSARRIRCQ